MTDMNEETVWDHAFRAKAIRAEVEKIQDLHYKLLYEVFQDSVSPDYTGIAEQHFIMALSLLEQAAAALKLASLTGDTYAP